MEMICSSEKSVDFQRTTRRYISVHNHRCENLKSYIKSMSVNQQTQHGAFICRFWLQS
jgi:hypothetical protein